MVARKSFEAARYEYVRVRVNMKTLRESDLMRTYLSIQTSSLFYFDCSALSRAWLDGPMVLIMQLFISITTKRAHCLTAEVAFALADKNIYF